MKDRNRFHDPKFRSSLKWNYLRLELLLFIIGLVERERSGNFQNSKGTLLLILKAVLVCTLNNNKTALCYELFLFTIYFDHVLSCKFFCHFQELPSAQHAFGTLFLMVDLLARYCSNFAIVFRAQLLKVSGE
jgi:hypothetical protein